MAVSIDTVTIGSVEDRRLCLSNGQVARKINLTTSSWSKLRMFFRVSVDDTGANLTGTPRFCWGFMSNPSAGVGNGPLSATTSHYVGVKTNISTWSRQSASGSAPIRYYLNTSSAMAIGTRVGTTESFTNASNFFHVSANPSTVRCGIGFEIEKITGSLYTLRGAECWANPTGMADISIDSLNVIMETEDFITALTENYTDQGLGSYGITPNINKTVDEATNGYLNAIVFGWDQTTPRIRISDVMWSHIS